MREKLHVKKDDTVVVISGKDKGKKGKVLKSDPSSGRIVVENVSMITRHTKPRRQGEQGGRIKKEGTIHASNVMLFCKHCDKPSRTGVRIEGDKKLRVCKKCGKEID